MIVPMITMIVMGLVSNVSSKPAKYVSYREPVTKQCKLVCKGNGSACVWYNCNVSSASKGGSK